jgi:hypothetical protein
MERPTLLLIPFRWTCGVCGGRATVAIRPLGRNVRRFLCSACAAALRKPDAQRPRKGNA